MLLRQQNRDNFQHVNRLAHGSLVKFFSLDLRLPSASSPNGKGSLKVVGGYKPFDAHDFYLS